MSCDESLAEVKAVIDMVIANEKKSHIKNAVPSKRFIFVRGAESTCNVAIQDIEKELW